MAAISFRRWTSARNLGGVPLGSRDEACEPSTMLEGYFSRDLEDLEDFDARTFAALDAAPSLVTAPGLDAAARLGTAAKQALLSASDVTSATTDTSADASAAAVEKAQQVYAAAAAKDGAVPSPGRAEPATGAVRAELPHHHRRRGIVAVMICYADGRKVVAL